MEKRIYCPNCARKGFKPRLVGIIEEKTTGAVRFWCRSCKCEVRAEIKDSGQVTVSS